MIGGRSGGAGPGGGEGPAFTLNLVSDPPPPPHGPFLHHAPPAHAHVPPGSIHHPTLPHVPRCPVQLALRPTAQQPQHLPPPAEAVPIGLPHQPLTRPAAALHIAHTPGPRGSAWERGPGGAEDPCSALAPAPACPAPLLLHHVGCQQLRHELALVSPAHVCVGVSWCTALPWQNCTCTAPRAFRITCWLVRGRTWQYPGRSSTTATW